MYGDEDLSIVHCFFYCALFLFCSQLNVQALTYIGNFSFSKWST